MPLSQYLCVLPYSATQKFEGSIGAQGNTRLADDSFA